MLRERDFLEDRDYFFSFKWKLNNKNIKIKRPKENYN
jgi:hypothetical protein